MMQHDLLLGKEVTILFDSWKTSTWFSYGLSLLAVFLAAGFYQYMEDRRLQIKAASLTKTASPPASADSIATPLLLPYRRAGVARLAVAVLFGVNSAIGYMLMLAVMSFNGGVFVAIVVGLAAGYLAFRSDGEEELIAVENPCACA